MRKVRVGDYVKIIPGKISDTLYLVREVGDWYAYLDWKDRDTMSNYRREYFDNLIVIYKASKCKK